MKYVEILILYLLSLVFGNNINTSYPLWVNDATIYEVNLRQYSEEGTFHEFRKHLPRLKAMGVDILWFMPIHPIGKLNRKGLLGSYYSVKDYYEINDEFGTKEEFENLVHEIHQMGMYVIIDWVANHTACDNQIVSMNPEWYTKNDLGKFQPPPGTDWYDVYDLNYDNKDLWEYMINAMIYWIKDVDIDGFRCDVAGMVPAEFWNIASVKLNAVKPVFMLAESEEPILLDYAFDADYNWGLYHIMKDIILGDSEITQIRSYYERPKKTYPKGALKMNFLDNHDENSWGRVMADHFGETLYPFLTMVFTLPGIPMIYSGQESKIDHQLKFFDKDTIEWNDFSDSQFYQNLTMLRKNHSTFWSNNSNLKFLDNLPKGLIGYKRWDENSEVNAIFNFSKERVEIKTEFDRGKIIFKDPKSIDRAISSNGYLIFLSE